MASNTRKTTVNWTDRETELLLTTIKQYKDSSVANGYDWTLLRERYDKIRDSFLLSYQKLAEVCDGFPNKDQLDIFTKSIVVNKIKRLRSGFREMNCKGKGTSNMRFKGPVSPQFTNREFKKAYLRVVRQGTVNVASTIGPNNEK